jgi:hypothetical protein
MRAKFLAEQPDQLAPPRRRHIAPGKEGAVGVVDRVPRDVGIDFLNRGDDFPGDRGARRERSAV